MKKFPKQNTPVFSSSPAASRAGSAKRRASSLGALSAAALLLFSLGSCSKTLDYFDYVSELRSNVLLATKGNLSLCVYGVDKESPYAADGVKRDVSSRAEIYLTAPTGIDSYDIAFSYEGKNYGGDMSFDNVKLEYFYSCSADISAASEIVFTVSFEDTTVELTAQTIRTEETLTPRELLEKVRTAESETFRLMTDKNGFAGEIYLRLIYEEEPYYYVGIIDKNGKILAFLTDSKEGKILAKREM